MVTEEDIKRIYGKEFNYEKIMETECYFNTLQDNQLVMWGDGKTYYWRLTKKQTIKAPVMPKTAEVGITKPPERPEDLPETITVITEDFIKLITIGGSLCHPKAPVVYKQRMEGEIRKIALRHHINYVGEIKE